MPFSLPTGEHFWQAREKARAAVAAAQKTPGQHGLGALLKALESAVQDYASAVTGKGSTPPQL